MSTTPEPASPKVTPSTADSGDATEAAEKPSADVTEKDAAKEPSETTEPAENTEPSETTEPSDESAEDESDEDESDEDESDEERQRAAEAFAAEHDPADHDLAAGEEFRQPGDWTAEDGGPQVWDSEGNLVSEDDADDGGSSDQGGATGAGGRRVSDLEEVRDGGYSVGSAATIHDGAMPLGHPVKAWEDTKTFVTEEHDLYDEAEPHVWFTDAATAEQAGFRPAD